MKFTCLNHFQQNFFKMTSINMSESTDYCSMRSKSTKDRKSFVEKKSILVTRGGESMLTVIPKRESSKATIHWKDVQETSLDEESKLNITSSLPSLREFAVRGTRWNMIEDVMNKLSSENKKELQDSDEDLQGILDKGVRGLVWNLGSSMIQKQQDKSIELTFEQEVNLEVLKQKQKIENEHYLRNHPELDILLSLVYRRLFKYQPDDPKLFVADYVHHLNYHREEMVLEEVDVPFDRSPSKIERTMQEEEREKIERFVRGLVEKCANTASLGEAYINVTSVIDSIMCKVSPSEGDITGDSEITAENIVSDIMTSLLTSVALARTRSAEFIVDEVLESILKRIHPSIRQDSEQFMGVRTSVEWFVKKMLKSLVDKVAKEKRFKEILAKSEQLTSAQNGRNQMLGDNNNINTRTKSILKVPESPKSLTGESQEARVTFQSKILE